MILDNYGTHKHPKVRAWLARHPRWIFHFTPTSASWMKRGRGLLLRPDPAQAEAGQLQRDRRPQAAINRYIAEHNDRPKPFFWTKPAAAILDAVNGNAAPSV